MFNNTTTKHTMITSKLGDVHIISFDIEDVSVALSNANLPFMLTDEIVDKILTGAIEDAKKDLIDVMYKNIVNQMFK
jgi:hypothetical protein